MFFNWSTKIWQIHIAMSVPTLSRYLLSAREDYLDEVFLVFTYLKTQKTSAIIFDDTEPELDDWRFKE